MRKLTGTLEVVKDTPHKQKPTLILKNKYGWEMSDLHDGDMIPKTMLLEINEQGYFEAYVEPTESFNDGRYYELKISDQISPIRLYIPDGNTDIDYKECMQRFAPPAIERFCAGETFSLEFVAALDSYMFGITPKDRQIKKVCDAFFVFADKKPDRSHDCFVALDEQLYDILENGHAG